MPQVVGIRFKDSGKIYFFEPKSLEDLTQGDSVIVETVRGPELAKVAHAPRDVSDQEIVGELKPVLRRAEDADFERMNALNERHDEVMARCNEKVQEHHLPMRLVKSEYSFDGSRLTFYFTAEKRVDFRLLVRDLARTFRTRIELRQIGPRDEAKLLGGIGPCGRLLCCATFLPDYARVSIKMAKDQDLPLNPTKISGVCGRLLCCLSYEHEQYIEIKAELPRKGAWVQTPEGPGEVVGVNVVRETVMVELASSNVQEEFKPDLLQEATRRVGELARSRNDEGITPLSQGGPRRPPPERPVREPKHHGERRLLRDEIAANPEVLEALAMLEDGDDWGDASPREERQRPPRDDRSRQNGGDQPRLRLPAAPAAPGEPDKQRRRPNRPQQAAPPQQAVPPREQTPPRQQTPPQQPKPLVNPAAEQPADDRNRPPRRRRRR